MNAGCVERGGYLATFETLEEAMLMKNELLKRNKGILICIVDTVHVPITYIKD